MAQTVTIGQIANGLSVSRQRADQLSRQVGFPAPVSESLQGRRWSLVAIRKWARDQGRSWTDPS